MGQKVQGALHIGMKVHYRTERKELGCTFVCACVKFTIGTVPYLALVL